MTFLEYFRDWEDIVERDAQSVIFSEGDPADVMYVVLSGEVELTLRGEQLATEEAGGIFGEMAMVDAATHCATSKALTDVRLARLDSARFREFVSRKPKFSLHVMAVLASRLRAVDQYITAQM